MSRAADQGPVSMVDGLAVRRLGDPAHPVVLLSAGLGGLGAYWTPQLEMLAQRYCVILYDHRGTGLSARDPLPAGYSVDHLADDMLGVLDALGIEQAHVIGHAAGGVAGLALARRSPERLRTLTIVNGWDAADPHFIRCFDIRLAMYDAGGADAYLKGQPLFLYPAGWISEHLAALDVERAAHGAAFQDRATLEARIGALCRFDARSYLSELAVPVLLVVSEDDMLVPPSASRRLADQLPNAAIAAIGWGGHAVNVTDPERFNHVLNSFLDNQQAA